MVVTWLQKDVLDSSRLCAYQDDMCQRLYATSKAAARSTGREDGPLFRECSHINNCLRPIDDVGTWTSRNSSRQKDPTTAAARESSDRVWLLVVQIVQNTSVHPQSSNNTAQLNRLFTAAHCVIGDNNSSHLTSTSNTFRQLCCRHFATHLHAR